MTITDFDHLSEAEQRRIIQDMTIQAITDHPEDALSVLVNVKESTNDVDRYAFLTAYQRIGSGLIKGVIGAQI